jgi:DNA polymerase-1
MEQNGFMLDARYCEEQAQKAKDEREIVSIELRKWLDSINCLAGNEEINWNSGAQVIDLLHNQLKLVPSPVWKLGRVAVDKGERKVDATALEYIRDRAGHLVRPGIDELLHLRKLNSSIKYLEKLPKYISPDGFIHPSCGPASDEDDRSGTITWRLAMKTPEVAQIPNDPRKDAFRIRRAFIAPPGHILIVADEKALEVVILAHLLYKLFGDSQLAEMVAPGAPDIHSYNARKIFGEYLGWERHGRPVKDFPLEAFQSDDYPELCDLRQDMKAVWYGLQYRKGEYGFATSLRDKHGNPIGEKAARSIINATYDSLPAFKKYYKFIPQYITAHDGIPGLGGAWCDLSSLLRLNKDWAFNRACRIAQNFPCQEGGARIIGHAMVEIGRDSELRQLGLKLERQNHDELDFRLPYNPWLPQSKKNLTRAKELISNHMTSYPLYSKLQVKIGHGENWDDAKHN